MRIHNNNNNKRENFQNFTTIELRDDRKTPLFFNFATIENKNK